jgi:hypothetical protein
MTSRLKPLLTVALACGMLAALVPSSASAARGMEIAVQDDSAFVTELGEIGDRVKALKLAEGLNATWIRANVNWSYVVLSQSKQKKQPANIEYNWTGYDALVDQAAARGIHVQLSLTGPAPAWATADKRVGPVKPKAGPFSVFARDAAEHFRGRVTRYSVWNEPNYVSWISPLGSAASVYRSLYIAGYAAIKKADPSAQVFIAETSPYELKKRSTAPLAFLRGVTCANNRYKRARKCAALKTDGFAHHPYDFHHAPTYKYPGKDNVTLATLSRLTGALSKLRQAKLLTTPTGGVPFVYLTEYGYFTSGKYKVPESKRARYLTKAFTIAQKNRRVKQMLQFLLLKPDSKYLFFATYLASAKGKPLPAYKALAAWIKRAERAGQVVGLP